MSYITVTQGLAKFLKCSMLFTFLKIKMYMLPGIKLDMYDISNV